MSSSTKIQSIYTLKSFFNESFLQFEENGTVTASGKVYDVENPEIYFYVVSTGDLRADLLQYQFKPYSQPDKYIAVVNGQVALKSESECTESERSFYIYEENEDYMSFYVKTSGTFYYLGCENDGGLYASTIKLEEPSWFHMLPKDKEIVLTETKEEIFFGSNLLVDLITEIALAEE